MERLLDAIADLVNLLSPEKIKAVASLVRKLSDSKGGSALAGAVSTPVAAKAADRLAKAWALIPISAETLAAMLLAAGHISSLAARRQSIELVWTGPTTPYVAARRTEQALLQVINSARSTLFITSFVAYGITSIIAALNAAQARGVGISMLLESSSAHGGSIDVDVIGKMRSLVPDAKVYSWRDTTGHFSNGRVHAKVAVADDDLCFITSANITGYAMERNMEAGVLIAGGAVPKALALHLHSLVDIKMVVIAAAT